MLPTLTALTVALAGAQGIPSLAAPLAPQERTRVLVLASPHLSEVQPESSSADALRPLLDRLERFAPTVVAIERVSGETVALWEKLAPAWDAVMAAFAGDVRKVGREAQAALGIDRDEAAREATELIDSWKAAAATAPDGEERRHAALLLAAAYELDSAALQWSYLPPDERGADETLPDAVAASLSRRLDERDERVQIAIALARKCRLERLACVDDQADAPFTLARGEELMAGLRQTPELARLEKSLLAVELPKRLDVAAKGADWLPLYRWINSREYAAADVDAQWHLFFRSRLASGLDRERAARWEVRNLGIVARIREASARSAGGRVLVVIGASHKPFLDAYLRSMMDVEVVAAEEVLGS
jgi:hypothetical protein